MIEVIRHGKFRRCECPNCLCVFKYEKEDTVYRQTEPNEWTRYIECPDCGERIWVFSYD